MNVKTCLYQVSKHVWIFWDLTYPILWFNVYKETKKAHFTDQKGTVWKFTKLFRIYVKSSLVIWKLHLKLQNLKTKNKVQQSPEISQKSISRKICWVPENCSIFHTVICQRPPEETQIILDLIPENLRTKIDMDKNQSMQVLLENSIHSDFGYILYGRPQINLI